ncbi:hypothetical protein H8957_002070, partial [Semnopithecus entellus]
MYVKARQRKRQVGGSGKLMVELKRLQASDPLHLEIPTAEMGHMGGPFSMRRSVRATAKVGIFGCWPYPLLGTLGSRTAGGERAAFSSPRALRCPGWTEASLDAANPDTAHAGPRSLEHTLGETRLREAAARRISPGRVWRVVEVGAKESRGSRPSGSSGSLWVELADRPAGSSPQPGAGGSSLDKELNVFQPRLGAGGERGSPAAGATRTVSPPHRSLELNIQEEAASFVFWCHRRWPLMAFGLLTWGGWVLQHPPTLLPPCGRQSHIQHHGQLPGALISSSSRQHKPLWNLHRVYRMVPVHPAAQDLSSPRCDGSSASSGPKRRMYFIQLDWIPSEKPSQL